jgi:hypothetical protein
MTVVRTFETTMDLVGSDKLDESVTHKRESDVAQIAFALMLIVVVFAVCLQCCRHVPTSTIKTNLK